MNNLKFAL